MKLIAMACSATKSKEPGMIPALNRYDGPMWQTLRIALRDVREMPQVWFLSARYGFQLATLPIPHYEHRLTDAPATMGNVDGFARSVAAADAVLFAGGHIYRDQMTKAVGGRIMPQTWGGIGLQRSQVRLWIAEHCR